jgi:peroxin-2
MQTLPRWERTWKDSQHYISAAKKKLKQHHKTKLPVQRINILEASVLDEEIFNLLESTFATVLGGARAMEQTAGPTSTWRRLLGLGLRLAVTGATVMINLPTPGQVLQNVRYRNEKMFHDPTTVGLLKLPNDSPSRFQRFSWIFLHIILPYSWSSIRYRLTLWFGSILRSKRENDVNYTNLSPPEIVIGKWIDYLESVFGIASLVNMLIFFQNGVYTTLVDRFLQMRQVPSRNGGNRILNFDFQNRQIVFNELHTFSIYILPMLQVYSTIRAGRRMTSRVVARMKRLGRHTGLLRGVSSSSAVTIDETHQSNKVVDKVDDCCYCGICPASIPYVTSCGCTLCYYCLRTNIDPSVDNATRQVSASCPSCGQHMKWSRRWEMMYGNLVDEHQ